MSTKKRVTDQNQDKDMLIRKRFWIVNGVVIFDRKEAVQTEQEK